MTMFERWFWILAGCWFALVIALPLLITSRWRWLFRTRRATAKWALLAVAVLGVLLAGEVVASNVVEPDSIGEWSLSCQRWFQRYWKPINRDGYRDTEWDDLATSDKRVLLVVGDSFAAGHGIENVEDRFAGVLQSKLGDGWRVVVLAKGGWSTFDELKALERWQGPVSALVLSYYLNDIDSAALAAGYPPPEIIAPPTGWAQSITRHSSLANLIYWRWIRFAQARKMLGGYWSYLQFCHRRPDVLALHAKELNAIAGWARARGIPFWSVVFPDLVDVKGTSSLTAAVSLLLSQAGAAGVLDLSPILAHPSSTELVVNRLDPHPNRSVHLLVGDALAQMIEAALPATSTR